MASSAEERCNHSCNTRRMTGDSFAPDDSFTIVGPEGQLGHRDLVEHTERFTPKLWPVTDGVWCFVGNGLSNQTFVEGPEGVIVIDTGESNEEMTSALWSMADSNPENQAAIAAANGSDGA